MPLFEIYCAQLDAEVEIHFGGAPVTRGDPEFRGFSCPNEAACQRARVECRLFAAQGFRPFAARDAFLHFNS